MVRTQLMLEVGPAEVGEIPPEVLDATADLSPDGVDFEEWAAAEAQETIQRHVDRGARIAQAEKRDFSEYGEPEDVRWHADFGSE